MPDTTTATSSHVRATPLVRALANRAGVDLTTVTGTGVGGRITTGDVRAAMPTPDPDGWFPGMPG